MWLYSVQFDFEVTQEIPCVTVNRQQTLSTTREHCPIALLGGWANISLQAYKLSIMKWNTLLTSICFTAWSNVFSEVLIILFEVWPILCCHICSECVIVLKITIFCLPDIMTVFSSKNRTLTGIFKCPTLIKRTYKKSRLLSRIEIESWNSILK